jgi:hypothetical protein
MTPCQAGVEPRSVCRPSFGRANTVFLELPCLFGIMEVGHLRYFLAVGGASNVTMAAAQLRVAQPGIVVPLRNSNMLKKHG